LEKNMLRVYLVWKDTNKKEMSAKIEDWKKYRR